MSKPGEAFTYSPESWPLQGGSWSSPLPSSIAASSHGPDGHAHDGVEGEGAAHTSDSWGVETTRGATSMCPSEGAHRRDRPYHSSLAGSYCSIRSVTTITVSIA